jgi:hypothetical protein
LTFFQNSFKQKQNNFGNFKSFQLNDATSWTKSPFEKPKAMYKSPHFILLSSKVARAPKNIQKHFGSPQNAFAHLKII